MKISLQILADWMQEYDPKVYSLAPEIRISEVRLYDAKNQVFEEQILYIGKEGDFSGNDGERILCKNKADTMLLNTKDLSEVLNRILDAFSYYARWEEECARRIGEGCLLSDLLDITEVLLRHPVQVVDGAQVIIGYSYGFSAYVEDDMWGQMIQGSGLPADILSQFNRIYLHTFEQKDVFYIPADIFPTASWCRHVFLEDARYATLIVPVFSEEFSKGEIQLIDLASEQVKHWIEANHTSDESAKTTSLLARLLDGMPEAGADLSDHLEKSGWKADCEKQLYVASFISQYFYMEALLSRLLSEHSSGIYAIPYQRYLVVLCNNDILDPAAFREDFTAFLKQNNYFAAYSFPFREYEIASQAYLQTVMSLERATPLVGQLYSSTENAMQYITDLVRKNSSLDLVHPVVRELKEYDKQHHTSFYQTLFCYLKNERNHQLTSQELFIHRNTLFKRLRKIEEIWPIDFENADLRFYILYSFYQDC